ncbi:MAG: radical SAM family heme chaperone HemW [Hyphomonadaceae bacterium]|nr:radical SAM family heme chaperone HemW [Hyphomonadaceae bacterium]
MKFGVYVHWPYCASICPYCDFNVRRDRGGDHGDLIAAIMKDVRAQAARIGKREVGSVFIGGGTPSLMKGADVGALIAAVDDAFGLAPGAEITLEANPEHASGFADLVAAGVNRLSLGVQALRAPALLWLGRRHSVREGIAAVEAAAKTGARVSIDLIYAREGQSTEEWRDELGEALQLPIEHLSAYQLTIEEGTPFARAVLRGRLSAQGEEAAATLYEVTQETCEAAGFPAYEISNHARGANAQSRHNLLYWRGEEWAGVGPSAHGRVMSDGARLATQAVRDVRGYIEAVNAAGVGWESAEALSKKEIREEKILMGLRLREGIARALTDAKKVEELGDLLCADEMRVRLTDKGRLLADRIAAELA